MAGYRVDALADAVAGKAEHRLPAVLLGDASRQIVAVAPLQSAGADELSFLANPRYRAAAAASNAGALVLTAADRSALFAQAAPVRPTLIECANPYAWFALAAQLLAPREAPEPMVAAAANVALDAQVDPSARIDGGAVVESRASIGAGCWIGAGAYVGPGARIGPDSRLHPSARVLAECILGARGIVHSGAVIGADGFGFAPLDGRWIKIPQTGRVVIGDDVEIGANTTIDRGSSTELLASPFLFNGSYAWTPSSSLNDTASIAPIASPDETTTYIVIGTNEFGCWGSDTITIYVSKDKNIINGFSPNGDGVNDRWEIPTLKDYPDVIVEVYNRWGEQVFRSEGYKKPWDGTYKGTKLPNASYYYVIDFYGDGEKVETGAVTILY